MKQIPRMLHPFEGLRKLDLSIVYFICYICRFFSSVIYVVYFICGKWSKWKASAVEHPFVYSSAHFLRNSLVGSEEGKWKPSDVEHTILVSDDLFEWSICLSIRLSVSLSMTILFINALMMDGSILPFCLFWKEDI